MRKGVSKNTYQESALYPSVTSRVHGEVVIIDRRDDNDAANHPSTEDGTVVACAAGSAAEDVGSSLVRTDGVEAPGVEGARGADGLSVGDVGEALGDQVPVKVPLGIDGDQVGGHLVLADLLGDVVGKPDLDVGGRDDVAETDLDLGLLLTEVGVDCRDRHDDVSWRCVQRVVRVKRRVVKLLL